MAKKPNILDYSDYREFLRDYVAFRKETSKHWSVSRWKEKLQGKSHAMLSMILKDRRHIGAELTEAFAEYFQFSEKEESYFRELVRVQKASKGDSRLTIFFLEKFKEEQALTSQRVRTAGKKLSFHWTAYVLRELTQLKDFKNDPKWIAERLLPEIREEDIAQLFEKLAEAGYIEVTADGSIKLTERLKPSSEVSVEETRNFHFELMEQAKLAFDQPLQRRAFTSATFCVKKEKVEEAQKLVRDFQRKFIDLVEETPGDEVYQFNMQFFPLTKTSD